MAFQGGSSDILSLLGGSFLDLVTTGKVGSAEDQFGRTQRERREIEEQFRSTGLSADQVVSFEDFVAAGGSLAGAVQKAQLEQATLPIATLLAQNSAQRGVLLRLGFIDESGRDLRVGTPVQDLIALQQAGIKLGAAAASQTGPTELDRPAAPVFAGSPFPESLLPKSSEVATLPFIPSSLSLDGGGIFESLLSAAPAIIGAFTGGGGGAPAAPGGLGLPQVPSFGLGLGFPGADLVPTGTPGASLSSVACITPRVGTTMRLPSRVDVPTVDRSGNVRFTTFKNMGRPVLWTGDFAAAKRVKRIASKARRRVGGR